MDFQLPEYNLRMMLPEIFLFLWAIFLVLFDVLAKRRSENAVGYLALAGILTTGAILSFTGYGRGFGNMFFNDPLAMFFKIIFLCAAFMTIGSSFGIMKNRIVNNRGGYLGLILMSTVGMMFLVSSHEMLSLYIGLELTTIPLFILAAFYKDKKLSIEAGIKYFVIGTFSSALLLYGISYLYGLSGTTDLLQMKINLAITHLTFKSIGVTVILSVVLILAGLGFKLALPPFHQWAPDVYEGSPTPIAAFLSVGSKAAGLAAFARIFVGSLAAFHGPEMMPNDWGKLVAFVAILAMVIGNIVAIRQTNIKRMLAYSSIAQAGYIMIGMVAFNEMGLSSMAYYTFIYMFANMGAFAIVTVFEDKTGSCQIASYRGLSKSSPMLSAALSVFLLSLAGIPPLAGFLAKYYVLAAAVKAAGRSEADNWIYWIVGVGLLTTVIALFYYANVIKQMYFSKENSPYKISVSAPAMSVIVIGLLGVTYFGLNPEPILKFAAQISSSFGFVAY